MATRQQKATHRARKAKARAAEEHRFGSFERRSEERRERERRRMAVPSLGAGLALAMAAGAATIQDEDLFVQVARRRCR